MSRFTCWFDDDLPEDGVEIECADADSAAELFVERKERMNAEYDCASGRCALVVVVKSDAGVGVFEVTGVTHPVYRARRLQETCGGAR